MAAKPHLIFDRSLIRHRLARVTASGKAEDFLLVRAIEELGERLTAIKRGFPAVLDAGTPLPRLAARLVEDLQPRLMVRMAPLADTAGGNSMLRVVGDEENLPLVEGCFDLAVSALSLQSLNDLPGALVQIRRVLRPDGLFLGCLLGGTSLHELRTALAVAETEIFGGVSPRVAPFADVRDMGGLLQRAGFALPVADTVAVTVRYSSMFGLVADLRAMGATNALASRLRRPPVKRFFKRAGEVYAERFAEPDGRVRATFEMIFLSGWAPHESQQKPLPPGSATMRLAEALGIESSIGSPSRPRR
ncbi:MAG: methyltransferase domain-containing protein [Beijerinckiaceae bacterium]|nr:methyltransferase domain-containing protein [Beijerinckiaceae bacterium]MCI0734796.1 methyltransferase domain-containing protein [Beijerinckiaceae bacterium]